MCKGVYHQSCSLRITGLFVVSGSKGLVQCASCAKNTRDLEVNKAISEAMAEKETEIIQLKSRISDFEKEKESTNYPIASFNGKLDVIEKILRETVDAENGAKSREVILKREIACINREYDISKKLLSSLEYTINLQKAVITTYEEKNNESVIPKVTQGRRINNVSTLGMAPQFRAAVTQNTVVTAENAFNDGKPITSPTIKKVCKKQRCNSVSTATMAAVTASSSRPFAQVEELPSVKFQNTNSDDNHNLNNVISSKAVSSAILEAQSRNMLRNVLHLNKDHERDGENQVATTCTTSCVEKAKEVVDLTDCHTEEDNWTEVKHGRNVSRRKRPDPIKGSRTWDEQGNNPLKAAEYHSWFFVTGLKPDTTQDDIRKYLDSQSITGSTIEKVVTRKDRIKSSFKVSVPRSQKQKVMKADFWPQGVSINHFLNLQRRPYMRYQGPSNSRQREAR